MPIDYTGFGFPKGPPRSVRKLEQQRKAKATEARVRKQVNVRDKHRCLWAGCRAPAHHKHHQVYRSRGGATASENLVSVCATNHRWVHDGLIRLVGNPDKGRVVVIITALGKAARIRLPRVVQSGDAS